MAPVTPSSDSQSGKAEQGLANELILWTARSEASASSSSPSSSDSQNAASSVLLGDAPSCLAGWPASHGPILWRAARTLSTSLQGARPVAISMTVHATAHTSAGGPCSSPRATSGAMNAGVPPMGRGDGDDRTDLAHPKSVSLARPSLPITTFPALTSPCTSERAWRYASPRATSPAYARMAGSAMLPPLLAASSASDPPGANLRNSWYSPPAAAREPRQGTMCGEQSPSSTCSSRRSCAAPAAPADLTARSCPEASSDASHTTAPDAPWPSVRTRLRCFVTAASICCHV
ncbi:hypothetical protein BS78_03G245300 [Paspalum vaginatum]|nr:hypothetical protein BS78_03G245300 [Paspalum vaginatum]